jgi:hypothetical protein
MHLLILHRSLDTNRGLRNNYMITLLHMSYVISLKYFNNFTLVLTHAQKPLFTNPSEYMVLTTLAVITHAQKTSWYVVEFEIVTIRTFCTCPRETRQLHWPMCKWAIISSSFYPYTSTYSAITHKEVEQAWAVATLCVLGCHVCVLLCERWRSILLSAL